MGHQVGTVNGLLILAGLITGLGYCLGITWAISNDARKGERP